MSEIRTVKQLAALPVGTVLRDGAGVVWLKFSGVMTEWRSTHGGIAPSEFVARKRWPLTVLHRPDLPTQADLHATVERVRAVCDPPKLTPLQVHTAAAQGLIHDAVNAGDE